MISNSSQRAGGFQSNTTYVGPAEEVHADNRNLLKGRVIDHLVRKIDAQHGLEESEACESYAGSPAYVVIVLHVNYLPAFTVLGLLPCGFHIRNALSVETALAV